MKKKSGIKNKIVLFQGTFEIINAGHIECFKLCKSFGDYFIIALNTDKLVQSYKHREPVIPYEQKKTILEAFRYVDKVVPAPHFSPMELLKKWKVDVYVVGYEWVEAHREEIAWIKAKGGEVHIMPDFGKVRTSQIKATLLKEAQKEGK
jgi:glycerol-3-phosphate cytidylyltransferase